VRDSAARRHFEEEGFGGYFAGLAQTPDFWCLRFRMNFLLLSSLLDNPFGIADFTKPKSAPAPPAGLCGGRPAMAVPTASHFPPNLLGRYKDRPPTA
jgi:hypothetical protein